MQRWEVAGNAHRPHVTAYLTMRRVLLLVCSVGALMGLLAADASTHTFDMDCDDFPFQTAAQNHNDNHLGDPDRLDPDFDGTPCEELPCPCGATPMPPATPHPQRSEAPTAPIPPLSTSGEKGRVVGVVDGNTLKVSLAAGAVVNVRLIGIDTSARRGSETPDACAARRAIARMNRLAFRNGTGRIVKLKSDPRQNREDRFARRLAYVDRSGVDLGRQMLSTGWAKVAVGSSGFSRLSTYREAEASAKAAKRGMWRGCD